jgi:CSLREA domain-containing protein
MRAIAPNGRTSLPVQNLNLRWSFWLWIALALPCLAAKAGPASPADGLTFTVNTTADDPDANAGDGLCETIPGNSVCTLRAAIEEANAQATDDTISFDLPLTDPGYDGTSWTISLLSALPDLSSNMTIEGPGPDLLAVTRSSTGFFRIFTVTSTGAGEYLWPDSQQRECKQRERRRNSE